MFSDFLLPDGPTDLRIQAGPANGPPLVLLHGVGRNGTDFLSLVPFLMTRWHLHLVDLRGHGGSGRTPGRYRVVDHVDDGIALLNWLGRPTVFLGHSLGALVALGVAAARPQLTQALILEDPPSASFLGRLPQTPYFATFTAMKRLAGSGGPTLEVAREFGETLLPKPTGLVRLATLRDEAALRFIARCLADIDGNVFTPALEGNWLDGFVERDRWRAITCPTLLLRGEAKLGSMLPDHDAQTMAEDIVDLTSILVPNVGHLIHGTVPEVMARHCLNFLESL